MRALWLVWLLLALPCRADEDEAWLHRAEVPAGTRPMLALLLDRAAATAQPVEAPAQFDPTVDYAADLPAASRCDAAGTWWRRGPGPAPDCHREASMSVLGCARARAPLAAYGFFVAPHAMAEECFGDGTGPRADAHVLYSGNYLNYLQSAPAPVAHPLASLLATRLADALAATADLDVALFLAGDGPVVPLANEVAAEQLRALATTSPAGGAALTDSLADVAQWLRGEPASGGSGIPFESACRPVSVAVLTTLEASADEQALAAELGSADLRDGLTGIQSAPVTWIAPNTGFSPIDPLSGPNLVAAALQHDAAVAADPQFSAAGVVAQNAESGNPGVILGLTAPRAHARWHGNFFRYRLRAPASPLEHPVLADRDGEPAIDPASGLPFPHTRSEWSDAPDANLLAGGAAGRLPSADARRIQSNLAGNRLLDLENALAPGELHGERTLGDPGLHAPVVVVDRDTGRVFALAATQDGLLHAFDAATGIEQWAFLPQELLPRLPELWHDAPMFTRSHGIDGPLVLHRDPSGDGQRWILFGLGRGGAQYYALDLADAADPRLLWSFALPDAQLQARGEPVVTRIAIADSGQSAGDRVVLLPGGYDAQLDAQGAAGRSAGGSLHVVDALTGRELWSLDGFAALPSAPRALDLDGDGDLDRAYLVDATGSLWRIDFTGGADVAGLASVHRMAQLGTGLQRFFATPDVSVTQGGGAARLAIAVGSGAVTRPRATDVVDRVYVVFDAVAGMPGTELTEQDLFDASEGTEALPPDARGWYLRLEAHGAGEKVIGPTVTFDHLLRFQTYQPLPPAADAPCGPPQAVARRYAIDLRTALPRNTAAESEDDEPAELPVSGLPPPLRFGFASRWDEPCEGCRPRAFGLAGATTFDPDYAGDPVRTSWRKLNPPPASP